MARALGLTALVEVHNEAELERALKIPNLNYWGSTTATWRASTLSLETTERLRPLIPAGITVVAESGIFTAADVAPPGKAGRGRHPGGRGADHRPGYRAKVRESSGHQTEKI
jgi:indole-3-glycerol phosphate synthase